ncbi:MAG: hypothetical protein D6712_16475 [Chloroflexi bacterium]|nr:MAG: hypothetical protein D6712_16475 [Chloroflexota bacterium]
MVNITLKGKKWPASLNGLALEIIADGAGKDFTDFFKGLSESGSAGKIDIKAFNLLLYAVLRGGALENGDDFEYTREQVAAWIGLDDIASVIDEVMKLVDIEAGGKKKGGRTKMTPAKG